MIVCELGAKNIYMNILLLGAISRSLAVKLKCFDCVEQGLKTWTLLLSFLVFEKLICGWSQERGYGPKALSSLEVAEELEITQSQSYNVTEEQERRKGASQDVDKDKDVDEEQARTSVKS